MEHDVFISHAYQDKSVADAICERLESAGLKCWTAARDAASADENWPATRNAIASSHLMVLVLSENANKAPHIKREIAHAFYTRRIIVPFRMAGAFPRRDFLFYLSSVPFFDAAGPLAEQLESLTTHIKGLVPHRIVDGDAYPTRQKTGTLSLSKSPMSAQKASHYRTVGILKWSAIGTALFAVVWFLWFTLWQPKDRASLTESQLQSKYRGSIVAPQPSPQPGGDALPAKPTDVFAGSGLWQGPNAGRSPWPQQASQVTPLLVPAKQSASVTSSPPEVIPGQRAGLTSALEPHGRPLPSLGVHRAPHYHHPQYQGTRTEEPRRNADLATSRSDALQGELTATETKLQTTQKTAELLAVQKDALQNELKESEARAQMVQKKADLLTGERDGLRDQLKETENRAEAAEKNEELATSERGALQKQLEESEAKARAAQKDDDLARSQLDALENRLKDTEAKAEMAEKKADLATSQRDTLETELGEAKERAQLAEMHANLAAGQRSEMEAALKKAEEKAQLAQENAELAASQRSEIEAQLKKTQEEKAQGARHDVELAGFYDSEPYTESQREDAHPDHEKADLATNQSQLGQMQPPNPGKNAKLAPLTQVLDSSVQSDHP
jgi:hypothetical protein